LIIQGISKPTTKKKPIFKGLRRVRIALRRLSLFITKNLNFKDFSKIFTFLMANLISFSIKIVDTSCFWWSGVFLHSLSIYLNLLISISSSSKAVPIPFQSPFDIASLNES